MLPIILAGPSLTGSIGTTETFVRIGHSLFALLAGWLRRAALSPSVPMFQSARSMNGGRCWRDHWHRRSDDDGSGYGRWL